MNSNLRQTVKLRRLRNGLLGSIMLIAFASLLGASTAYAGFFNNLLNQAKNKAVQTIKHDLGNQATSKPTPANPQPASTPTSPANQPASTPAPVSPQPAAAPSSPASQPPAVKPVGTQSGSLTIASASGNPGPVTVVQKVVGPLLRDSDRAVDGGDPAYTVSLHGSHLAAAHMHGSRFVVTVDGVDGPRVGAILSTFALFANKPGPAEAVAMSDDGRHYAYEARLRGEIEVFEDGRKILQFPRHGAIQVAGDYLAFSPHGGAHLFFAAEKFGTEDEELWVDGKPAPAYIFNNGLPIITFSADGQHYLYVGTLEHGSSKHFLVVDGKKEGYRVEGITDSDGNFSIPPRFTADGRHVLSLINGYFGKNGQMIGKVLLDGKPVVTAGQIDSLVTAPKGSSWAAVVTEGSNSSQNAVYLNGKEVPGTRGNYDASYSLPVAKFSPDGKHLAVACNYGAGNAYVVLDGKEGETYDKIHASSAGSNPDAMKFSADSQSFGYFADAGSKTFAVVDGHEYDPGFSSGVGQLHFSPEGHHVAVEEVSGQVLYVDGKRVSTASEEGDFTFDRDGSHWMIHGTGIVVDGRSLPFLVSTRVNGCRFSPDGNEVAVLGSYRNHPIGMYLYNTSTGRIRLLTKGSVIGLGGLFGSVNDAGLYHLVFSPDSKHLYYACVDVRSVHATATIYVDGEKTAMQFAPTLFPPAGLTPSGQQAGCWQVGADDKLHALCAVNHEVERITITPPRGGLE